MKKFNRPYINVINLDQNASVSTTCVIECECDIVSCTCDEVCGCVGDCTIQIVPSNQ